MISDLNNNYHSKHLHILKGKKSIKSDEENKRVHWAPNKKDWWKVLVPNFESLYSFLFFATNVNIKDFTKVKAFEC